MGVFLVAVLSFDLKNFIFEEVGEINKVVKNQIVPVVGLIGIAEALVFTDSKQALGIEVSLKTGPILVKAENE